MRNVSISLFTNAIDGSRVVTTHRSKGQYAKIGIYFDVTRASAQRISKLSKDMEIRPFDTGGVGWTAKDQNANS